MDATYDVASAGKKLEQIAMKRAQGDDGSYQLSVFMQNEHLQQNIRVIKYEQPTTWRLIYEGNGHANAEEVVLRIQGVIALKDLPPLTNKPKDTQKNIHLRQAVSLIGLGTDRFKQAIEGIVQIHTIFSRTFKEGMLDHWQPSSIAEYQAIDMANRYFTSRRQNPNAVPIDFHSLVDPNRTLCDMAVGDLVHCEENDVHYLELYINEDLQEKYRRLDPTMFKTGDLVEAQVSLMGVPLKGGKVKFLMVLRALTLLDCQQSMEAQRNRTMLTVVPTESRPTLLKRKVGYGEEDRNVSETRRKFQHMTVDEEN